MKKEKSESKESSNLRVCMATPYQWKALSSTGDASYMFLGQYNFPYEYDRHNDVLLGADHDRLLNSNHDHFRRCLEKHEIKGESGLRNPDQAAPEKMIDFLKDVFQVEEKYPEVKKWTGWRILGTVNRATGYPVFSLELFANNSGTEVYSDQNAPNVKRHEAKIYHDKIFGYDY